MLSGDVASQMWQFLKFHMRPSVQKQVETKLLSFGGRQSSQPPYQPYAKFTKIVLTFAAVHL